MFQAALASEHLLGNRVLEVKVATPKVNLFDAQFYCLTFPIIAVHKKIDSLYFIFEHSFYFLGWNENLI